MVRWMASVGGLACVLLAAAGCGPALGSYEGSNGGYAQSGGGYSSQAGVGSSSGGAVQVASSTGGGQYLYLPGTNISLAGIQSAVVQSQDGRSFTLTPADIQAAAAGRLAVALPAGVTTGTVTLVVNGQQISIPFHVVVSMAQAPVIGSVAVQQSDPRCAALAGSWVGTITDNAPGSVARVHLTVLSDCRTVQGFIAWSGPTIGSVDSTIEGTWEPNSSTLVARDTQLFNVRPLPGGGFCATDRYALTLTPDGQLVGENVTMEPRCGGGRGEPVRLVRGQ